MANDVKYSTGSHSMNYCILKIDFTVYIGNTLTLKPIVSASLRWIHSYITTRSTGTTVTAGCVVRAPPWPDETKWITVALYVIGFRIMFNRHHSTSDIRNISWEILTRNWRAQGTSSRSSPRVIKIYKNKTLTYSVLMFMLWCWSLDTHKSMAF